MIQLDLGTGIREAEMLDDPWDSSALRDRAMQCRHLAAGIRDVEIQSRLLLVALDYEEMAFKNERRKPAEYPKGLARRMERRAPRRRTHCA